MASFSDNPARKVLSLMMGSIMGILAASLIGLNLFLATLGADAKTSHLAGRIGVVLTGFIVGLGANPTHEVINALQRSGRTVTDTSATTSTCGEARTLARTNMLAFAGPLAVAESAPRAAVPINSRQVRASD